MDGQSKNHNTAAGITSPSTLKKTGTPSVHFRSSQSRDQNNYPTVQAQFPSTPSGLSGISPSVIETVPMSTPQGSDSVSYRPHQSRRMSLFEPYSLPASRVPSHDTNQHSLQLPHTESTSTSPMHSPPLTPADTHERLGSRTARLNEVYDQINGLKLNTKDPAAMTPQQSPPRSMGTVSKDDSTYLQTSSLGSSRPSSSREQSGGGLHSTYNRPAFQIGPVDSHEELPLESSSASISGSISGWAPPSRPFTPVGEIDDPYARSKRLPQSKNPQDIEPRFIFGRTREGSPTSSNGDLRSDKHRHSHLSLTSLVKHGKDSSTSLSGQKTSSMAELKRFFKPQKRSSSPSGSAQPSRSTSFPMATPFSDDHGLQKKYGKFGRVLGSGAGGSVRLMKRSSDGVTFAVKEFRAKHNYESEREYAKKVTAEFCIGSTLHHGNVVETLDIVHEKGKWYEVMEYCPYDLFATVMTGKMTREEISCAFMQIVNGVTYLHAMGLAHRDLKLDNVVINEHGILKIIDFGSASVFRYPFETDIVEACGIVGSDPYLAPEVCDNIRYDPQPADIWSLAIIFCCMSLRRFPWKAPRMSDKSFKLFCAKADESPVKQTPSVNQNGLPTSKTHQKRPTLDVGGKPDEEIPSPPVRRGSMVAETEQLSNNSHNSAHITKENETKGPFRLLRLLPRESRPIIAKMLELDPKKRATLDDIWRDPWVSTIQICRQDDDGAIHKAPDHTHTLEGQVNNSSQSSRKSTK